ncbi:uncharacterized protein LOC133199816 [Saccostrea echinata]|uniref:uncharacterized protein LOC133199816 n=1 Tax=Saccostrea echinata TaxID=191078 RepID=UPI002A82B117|nr:uncharacterized protein LOC133199816 [Saccostrea echinata]
MKSYWQMPNLTDKSNQTIRMHSLCLVQHLDGGTSRYGINADGMSYVKFRHAWYSYLALLDINYDLGFQCDICGPSQSTILPPEHRPLLELLASPSPACALIPYNTVNEKILSKIFESPKDISRDAELLNSIQINIPLLFEILRSVSFEISSEYKEIISKVFAKSKATFPNPNTSDQFHNPKTEDPVTKEELDNAAQIAFFPKLEPIRQRGRYAADKGKFNAESCRKDSTKHPTLLPGIFTVFCQHGICYGFQIMENNESPNVPFTFIRTRFLTGRLQETTDG